MTSENTRRERDRRRTTAEEPATTRTIILVPLIAAMTDFVIASGLL